MKGIPTQERNDITPLCPHCGAEISVVYLRVLKSRLGKRYLYFCSDCCKVLGVSDRKGFWMP